MMDKELDFAKFIHFKRITKTAMIALLNPTQKKFADRFSTLVIRESSDLDNTSLDDELSGNAELDQGTQAIGTIINSENKVDRRLIDIYKVRKINELVNYGEMEGILNRNSSTLASDLVFRKGVEQFTPRSDRLKIDPNPVKPVTPMLKRLQTEVV